MADMHVRYTEGKAKLGDAAALDMIKANPSDYIKRSVIQSFHTSNVHSFKIFRGMAGELNEVKK